jgi:hypothetical protein
MREIFNREPLPPPENAVVTALFSLIHQDAFSASVLIKDLTRKVNEILKTSGERFQSKPRKVVAVLAILGVGWKKRINLGWTVLLNQREPVTVHKLVKSHGLDLNIERFLRADLRECPLCKGDSLLPEVQSDPPPQVGE